MTPQPNTILASLQIDTNSPRATLQGSLHFDTVMQVHHVGQVFIKQHNECVIDLNEVSSSDSSALALLLDWLRYARQQGKTIQFVNWPNQLLAIAKANGVSELLTHHD